MAAWTHHWPCCHGHRVRHRRPPFPLAVQAHPLRQEGPQPVPGSHQVQGGGRDGRGRRSAKAPAVDGPRPGPLLHHVGLHHPAAHDHRRRPLQQSTSTSPVSGPGTGSASSRTSSPCRPDRPDHVRGHPREERTEPAPSQVTLLRLPSRCCLARPPHDRRYYDHPAPLPGCPGQHRPDPVPLRLGRSPPTPWPSGRRRCSGPAPTRCW